MAYEFNLSNNSVGLHNFDEDCEASACWVPRLGLAAHDVIALEHPKQMAVQSEASDGVLRY